MFSASDYSIERSPSMPILKSIYQGLSLTITQGALVAQALTSMVKRHSMEGVGGPVSIISEGLKNAREGAVYFFMFLAFISVNLALLNLLPLGIVDGGRILFITLEAIFRRSIPEVIQITVNLISIFILVALMLILTYRDILGLIFHKH